MGASQQVMLAQNIVSGAVGTAVVTTAASAYSNRSSNFWFGARFTVGGANITLTDVAWAVTATYSGTRNFSLWNYNSSGAYAVMTTGVINLSGIAVGNYQYGAATPQVLTSGLDYLVALDDLDGSAGTADVQAVTFTSAISAIYAVYATQTTPAYGDWLSNSNGFTYGGVNFKAY